jgi:hypothetical protein
MIRATRSALAVSILTSLTLTACSGATPAGRTSGPSTTTIAPPTAAPTTVPTTTTTTVPIEQGWTPITTGPNGVITDQRNVTVLDGRTITVIRFRAGQVRFNLHVGSQDPPVGTVVLGPQSKSSVSPTEIPYLVAAFNGGFKVNGAAGGVDVEGQTITPLQAGFASFVIDADGTGHIGVWGSTVPYPGEMVSSVRQNLPPLIENGKTNPQIDNIHYWGDPLHELALTARSALGQDAAGNILYAANMSALPVDLAAALSSVGATVAMELDINPNWIQCDVASAAGGTLVAAVPGQMRPATQYLSGWTRDFITVLVPAWH